MVLAVLLLYHKRQYQQRCEGRPLRRLVFNTFVKHITSYKCFARRAPGIFPALGDRIRAQADRLAMCQSIGNLSLYRLCKIDMQGTWWPTDAEMPRVNLAGHPHS